MDVHTVLLAIVDDMSAATRRMSARANATMNEAERHLQCLRKLRILILAARRRNSGAPRVDPPSDLTPLERAAREYPIFAIDWVAVDRQRAVIINERKPPLPLSPRLERILRILEGQPIGADGFPERITHEELRHRIEKIEGRALTRTARSTSVNRLVVAFETSEAEFNPFWIDSDPVLGIRLLLRPSARRVTLQSDDRERADT